MNINYSIEKCRQDIYNIINNSELPIGAIYFILKAIETDVETFYKESVLKERQELINNDIKE